MIEIDVINQRKNMEIVKMQAKPAIGEIINLPSGGWGVVTGVEHFDGGKIKVYIDEASSAVFGGSAKINKVT